MPVTDGKNTPTKILQNGCVNSHGWGKFFYVSCINKNVQSVIKAFESFGVKNFISKHE
jgi:hypothetical protein